MAANPKLATRSNSCEGEPLDKLNLTINKHGTTQEVPALHRGWADKRDFSCYDPPPNGPQIQMNPCMLPDLQKAWVDKTTFYLEDLKWLLQLPHHRFWSQIVYDQGVHDCLDSFLSQAPRYFDPPDVQLTDKMKETLQEVFRCVFAVYLRMGTYKESKSCHITPQVFGEIIYDNFVFDIPKVMDLCVLYCQGNSSLLGKLIDNIFKYQPKYHDDLSESVPTVFQSFDNVQSHLGLDVDCSDGNVKLARTNPTMMSQFSHLSWTELKDVLLFLLDISTTLCAFLDVYPPACNVFHKQGLLLRIASFYDVVIPAAQSELASRVQGDDDAKLETDGMLKKLLLIKSCLLKVFHSVISTCCFQLILDCPNPDDALIYVEDFFQIVTAVLSEKHFVCDYQKKHPLEEDIEMISQTGIDLDITRLEYIMNGVAAVTGKSNSSLFESILGAMQNDSNASRSKFTLQDNATLANNWELSDVSSGACAAPTLNGIELESLITQVKDLLPNLGDGFIEICLEYYNYKTEAVINAILEDSLPSILGELDRTMIRKVTPPVPTKVDNTSKLEDVELPLASVLTHRANIFDNDEFDVFNRLTLDETRVHKGKKATSSQKLIDDRSESHRETLKNVYEKYNVVVDEVFGEAGDLYNDEYDDTYDEHTVGASEPKTETDELLTRRPFVVPRVLADAKSNRDRVYEVYESESDSEKGDEKPRDCFVQNPEEVRRKYEEARQMRFQNRNFRGRGGRGPPRNSDVKGQAKGQGQSDSVLHNRANKERNKSARGNHNRRMMSDRKRSRGMIPS